MGFLFPKYIKHKTVFRDSLLKSIIHSLKKTISIFNFYLTFKPKNTRRLKKSIHSFFLSFVFIKSDIQTQTGWWWSLVKWTYSIFGNYIVKLKENC